MAPLPKRARSPIFQLRVTLQGIQPEVWRRLLVPSAILLPQLHRAIQAAMGWNDTHAHAFAIGERHFGDRGTSDEWDDLSMEDERKLSLRQLAGPDDAFHYIYDFGDDWRHYVEIETDPKLDLRLTYPLCTAGARACPPDDCGGAAGYEGLLDLLKHSTHDRHDAAVAWLGAPFDPEGFDLNLTNRAIWSSGILQESTPRPREITAAESMR